MSDDIAPAPAVTSTDLLASKRESALALMDCLTVFFRCAGCIGAQFLFAAYQATVQAAALSQGFGAGPAVFPKSGEVNAQGLLIRSPGSLRPLTLCNCDCKILTAAVCSGLRRYSVECIHPSQRCVTQRIMTEDRNGGHRQAHLLHGRPWHLSHRLRLRVLQRRPLVDLQGVGAGRRP